MIHIGVCSISWNQKEIPSNVFDALTEFKYDYIESPFSAICNGYPVRAVQSVFYGIEDAYFWNERVCIEHMDGVIQTCLDNRIEIITFGSPAMRVGKKKLMVKFLKDVDKMLEGVPIRFCVEPNASVYGAEYFNTIGEIVPVVEKLNNISSMIDIGNSLLEGMNPLEELDRYYDNIHHVHFSAPHLAEIHDFRLYKKIYESLMEKEYRGKISYELKNPDDIYVAMKNFYDGILK